MMYIPPLFAEDRPEVLAEAIRRHPLAALVTLGTDGLEASHLPLLLDPRPSPYGTLLGHLARPNPQWQRLDPGVEALTIFSGPQAYVTPSWYETKRETGKVVPTWNYLVVHVRGHLRLFTEPAALRGHVEHLTRTMEANRPEPWSLGDAPTPFVEAMLRGIVGIALEITRLEGKWKMSQNRPDADRVGVIEGLSDGDAEGQALAEVMRSRQ